MVSTKVLTETDNAGKKTVENGEVTSGPQSMGAPKREWERIRIYGRLIRIAGHIQIPSMASLINMKRQIEEVDEPSTSSSKRLRPSTRRAEEMKARGSG